MEVNVLVTGGRQEHRRVDPLEQGEIVGVQEDFKLRALFRLGQGASDGRLDHLRGDGDARNQALRHLQGEFDYGRFGLLYHPWDRIPQGREESVLEFQQLGALPQELLGAEEQLSSIGRLARSRE